MPQQALEEQYRLIERNHRQTIIERAARVVLAGSVLRVFESETNDDVVPVLASLRMDELPGLAGQEQFRAWFNRSLARVAEAILIRNADNPRIHPGLKWGHGTKVLTLFVREIVFSSRYFTDEEVERIGAWLYTPLDRVALRCLRQLGHPCRIDAIKDIATAEIFHGIQDDLGEAAAKVGVPRVWFDDVWTQKEYR